MFDALKVDLEARQQEQWPLIRGIGDIMLDHFNLETDKGKNFQQQVAKWVSKDNDANAQIKKWQSEEIEHILGKEILSVTSVVLIILSFYMD